MDDGWVSALPESSVPGITLPTQLLLLPIPITIAVLLMPIITSIPY